MPLVVALGLPVVPALIAVRTETSAPGYLVGLAPRGDLPAYVVARNDSLKYNAWKHPRRPTSSRPPTPPHFQQTTYQLGTITLTTLLNLLPTFGESGPWIARNVLHINARPPCRTCTLVPLSPRTSALLVVRALMTTPQQPLALLFGFTKTRLLVSPHLPFLARMSIARPNAVLDRELSVIRWKALNTGGTYTRQPIPVARGLGVLVLVPLKQLLTLPETMAHALKGCNSLSLLAKLRLPERERGLLHLSQL